nr:MBL fold metallo-hydrolase [uncultured Cellulosilyticum sp.]
MKLKVLASGSEANSYILENEHEALVIEAGVSFKELVKHIEPRKIKACLVSHEHNDHAKYVEEYRSYGINVFSPYNATNFMTVTFEYGGFRFFAYKNHHNVKCYGFIVKHNDLGKLIFATDTGYIQYKFNDVNHWLIECNYSEGMLTKSVEAGIVNPVLADRIVKDHMSLETCKTFFERNNLSKTRSITLIHLSNNNSNARQFQEVIHNQTGKDVYIAQKGLEIDLSLYPL